jgi:hypothetical protein
MVHFKRSDTVKKQFVIVAIFMLCAAASPALELGARWGDVSGGDVAVDAVFSMGEYSRIHTDVSFGDDLGIDLLFDFLYKPLGDSPLHWYAGVGPYAVFGDPFTLGIVGELGLEYRFDFPISVSADWRPAFRIIDDTDFSTGGFGLNVRYIF